MYIDDNHYIVEIGTGCGLITNSILEKNKNLKKYDSYEPDRSLRKNIKKSFSKYKNFSNYKGDGSALSSTNDEIANLVCAYGVFSLIPIAVIVSYLNEAKRVLKKGGVLAFDIFDTDCGSEELFKKFILQASRNDSRPFISSDFLISLMSRKVFY